MVHVSAIGADLELKRNMPAKAQSELDAGRIPQGYSYIRPSLLFGEDDGFVSCFRG
jgi:hypothetical protein